MHAQFRRRLRGQLPADVRGLIWPGIDSRIEAQVTDAVKERVDEAVLAPELWQSGWRRLTHQHMQSQVNAQHLGAFEELIQNGDPPARLDLEVLPRVHAELTALVAAQAGVCGTARKVPVRLPRLWWRGTPWPTGVWRPMRGLTPWNASA
ncbi:hypothetical protein ABZ208_33050 [Streptomyces sp. NPDC006208]|uniref:hypothetical protein n=1 Tax=Streptomyces sp. NPDC006208 TaxID=3156734 RepID=UPI0033A6DC56